MSNKYIELELEKKELNSKRKKLIKEMLELEKQIEKIETQQRKLIKGMVFKNEKKTNS